VLNYGGVGAMLALGACVATSIASAGGGAELPPLGRGEIVQAVYDAFSVFDTLEVVEDRQSYLPCSPPVSQLDCPYAQIDEGPRGELADDNRLTYVKKGAWGVLEYWILADKPGGPGLLDSSSGVGRRLAPRVRHYASNGEVVTELRLKPGETMGGEGWVRSGSGYAYFVMMPLTFPFFPFVPCPDALRHPAVEVLGEETVQGVPCYKLSFPDIKCTSVTPPRTYEVLPQVFLRVWIAPSFGFMPVRWEGPYSPRKPDDRRAAFVWVTEGFHEVQPGVWFPRGSWLVDCNGKRTHSALVSAQVNHEIPDSRFVIAFPPGCTVRDGRTGREFVVPLPDEVVEEKTGQLLARARSIRASQTPQTAGPPARVRGLLPWGLAGGSLALLSALVLFVRKQLGRRR